MSSMLPPRDPICRKGVLSLMYEFYIIFVNPELYFKSKLFVTQCGVSLKLVFTVRLSGADKTGFEKTIM